MITANEISGSMVGEDNDIGSGLELRFRKCNGYRHQLSKHFDNLILFFKTNLQEQVLSSCHMIGESPWPHYLADNGHSPPDLPAELRNGIEDYPHGGLLKNVFRDDDIREIRMWSVPAVRHLVTRSPIHIAPQSSGLLVNTIFGHDVVKTDDFMSREGKFGHCL